ncbi:hypothetical protein [Streptomyces sp. SAS_276]|uniref:hypothetical protein n=1 Tax=Streptomyces sp. SAS_276 TaxID=3412745 RepID=UPI00403C8757
MYHQQTKNLLAITAEMALIEGPVLTCAVSLLDPGSRGMLRLADTDPASAPLADTGFLTQDNDRAGLRRARELFRTPTLANATRGCPGDHERSQMTSAAAVIVPR